MKLQFDANQQYQLDAVAAIADLFEGQPQGAPEYSIIQMGDMGGIFAGQQQTELGLGNGLLLSPDKLRTNVRSVQARNDIDIPEPSAPTTFICSITVGRNRSVKPFGQICHGWPTWHRDPMQSLSTALGACILKTRCCPGIM